MIGHGFMPDTGGPGQHRGGVGTYRDVRWLEPTTQSTANPRARQASPGVNGGRPGRLGGAWVWRSDEVTIDDQHPLPVTMHDPIYAKAIPMLGLLDPVTHQTDPDGTYFNCETSVPAPAGSVVRIVSRGAGGWGDPLARDTELVRRDVRDGYVTVAGARRDYGVVIIGDPDEDPEGITIDDDATTTLRAELHQPQPA